MKKENLDVGFQQATICARFTYVPGSDGLIVRVHEENHCHALLRVSIFI